MTGTPAATKYPLVMTGTPAATKYPLVMTGNVPMDSQQCGFLNKSSTLTPVDMATKTGKIPHIPISR